MQADAQALDRALRVRSAGRLAPRRGPVVLAGPARPDERPVDRIRRVPALRRRRVTGTNVAIGGFSRI